MRRSNFKLGILTLLTAAMIAVGCGGGEPQDSVDPPSYEKEDAPIHRLLMKMFRHHNA